LNCWKSTDTSTHILSCLNKRIICKQLYHYQFTLKCITCAICIFKTACSQRRHIWLPCVYFWKLIYDSESYVCPHTLNTVAWHMYLLHSLIESGIHFLIIILIHCFILCVCVFWSYEFYAIFKIREKIKVLS
jgi:hypothetical protein